DVDGVAGVVDEHLLAGAVILPQHDIQVSRPIPILLAKPTVTDPVGMIFLVFLPEQLQGHATIRLQFLMDFGEVRLRPGCGWRRHWWKQELFQLAIVQFLRQRPAQPRGGRPLQKTLYGSFAHPADRRDLALSEVNFMMESEDFSDLTHG